MKQILWTGFTIVLTIAIILGCTYFPSILWNMTFSSTAEQQSIALQLPDMNTFIDPEEIEIVPTYFPSDGRKEQYPNAEYEVLSTNTSTYESEEGQAFISAFSKLVSKAIYDCFGMSCTPEIIFEYTDLWRVFITGNPRMIEFYGSCTVILQQDHVLWQVTAYGSADTLTHLSRTPYSATGEEKTLADIYLHDYTLALSDEQVLEILLEHVKHLNKRHASYFNTPFVENMEEVLAEANYIFYNMGDFQYKLTLWSGPQEKTYSFTFHFAQSGPKLNTFILLLSIQRTE